MKRTLGFFVFASILLFIGACNKTTYTPAPTAVDKGLAYSSRLEGRRIFAASTITYGTTGSVSSRDTLSIYQLTDTTIQFRNDTLRYKAFSIDTIHGNIQMTLSQYATTANGNITTATFTYYYGNDSVAYFYSTKLYPLFTTGYEVSMHTL